MPDVLSVGFVGLGRMGGPMAANVARGGFPLTVHNRTREKAEALAAEVGASVAGTPAEAARSSDVVVTMLADERVAGAVYEGEAGVLEGLRPGSTVVEMSTLGPEAVGRMRERVEGVGCRLVDAPVSGGPSVAEAGELSIMAGGAEDDVQRVRPVLEAMGKRVYHLGPSGTGAAMKLAVNALVFAVGQGVAEALVLAERSGIDRFAAYEVIADSAISSPMIHYRRDAYERPGEVPPAFALTLATKDLRLITRLAERLSSPMPQASVNLEIAEAAVEAGFGEDDMAAVAQYLRQVDGRELRNRLPRARSRF